MDRHDGMWCLKGRFDPVTALRFSGRLDNAVETLFADKEPPWCPTEPVERQKHLRAIALARLAGVDVNELLGAVAAGPPADAAAPLRPLGRGRPEMLAVIHVDATSSGVRPGGSCSSKRIGHEVTGADRRVDRFDVEWALPVEIPESILAELAGDADIHAIIVGSGIVLHAPSELDLGRTTRLANRAQRRALRAMYSTCAIPGCSVRYDRCKIHHIIRWRHGGRTDLDNLLPLCSHHHTRVHHAGWNLTLGPDRELSIRFPDGTIHNTGPPDRNAA